MKIKTVIFFVFAFGISQNFQNSIMINPDQLGQSGFYIRASNPYLFVDGRYRTLRFEGNLGLPVGNFMIPDILPFFKTDTSMTTYFRWNQGDYRFRQIQLGLRNQDDKGNTIDIAGVARSFTGKYSHLGPEGTSSDNVLQNYSLGVQHQDDRQKMEFDWFYHKENVGLPIFSNSYFNRQVESLLIGGSHQYQTENFENEITGSTQIYQEKHGGWNDFTDLRTVSMWFSSSTNYLVKPNLSYQIRVNYKRLGFQDLINLSSDMDYFSVFNGFNWNINRSDNVSGGIRYLDNNKIMLEYEYKYLGEFLSVNLIRKYSQTFYHVSDFQVKTARWFDNSVSFSYQSSVIKSEIEAHLINFYHENIWVINPSLDITLSWLSLSFKSSINSADSSLFSSYSFIKTNFTLPLKNKPYSPFFRIEGVYLTSKGPKVFDFLTPGQISAVNVDAFDHRALNSTIGLLFDKFEISVNMIQFLVPNSTISPYILPIEPLNYLQVTWIFTD